MILEIIIKLLITMIIFDDTTAQVAFPERNEFDKKKSNIAGRLPLYSPTRCKHDELLYPGDQQNDWICDCAPGAVYHPESDACYPAFRQGPCPAGQFLILRQNTVIPECIQNICRVDGQITIHNTCYSFGEGPPCRNPELSYVLGVNPNTLLVDCVRNSISLATRIAISDAELEVSTNATNYDWDNLSLCAPGSQRLQRGTCKVKV